MATLSKTAGSVLLIRIGNFVVLNATSGCLMVGWLSVLTNGFSVVVLLLDVLPTEIMLDNLLILWQVGTIGESLSCSDVTQSYK